MQSVSKVLQGKEIEIRNKKTYANNERRFKFIHIWFSPGHHLC